MKKSLLISLLICSNALAWENPNDPFSTKENVGESMLISWKTTDNIQKVCQDEYKKRGLGSFNYAVDACSFWNFTTRTCTIYTKKNPTLHDVGHEIRHCYQGNYH